MPPAYRALAAIAAFAWIGCTGGQSGTETPTPRPMDPSDGGGFTTATAEGGKIATTGAGDSLCACALAGRGALLRGRLLALDSCQIRVRVEEMLALPEGQTLRAEAGDTVTARHAADGCSEGLALEPGDEVLLVYAEAEPDGRNEALVARWEEPFLFGSRFGEPLALAREQQFDLLDAEACAQAFASDTDASPMEQKLPAPTCTKR